MKRISCPYCFNTLARSEIDRATITTYAKRLRKSKDEYDAMVRDLIRFLEGDTDEVVAELTGRMHEASTELEFELAARLRDRLQSVKKAIEKQQIAGTRNEDFDVIGIHDDELEASVQVFFVRKGRVMGRRGFVVDKAEELDRPELVSRVLEKRCGTLDCHGTLARPLRVYGQRGLRLLSDEERAALAAGDLDTVTGNGTVPGDKATTPEELAATRRSICALEPERMVQYQAGELDERELILLTKPLELERHKGGTLLVEGGAAFTCISTWLQGNPNDASCEEAAQAL